MIALSEWIKSIGIILGTLVLLKPLFVTDIEKKIEPFYMQFFRRTYREFFGGIVVLVYVFIIPYMEINHGMNRIIIYCLIAIFLLITIILAIKSLGEPLLEKFNYRIVENIVNAKKWVMVLISLMNSLVLLFVFFAISNYLLYQVNYEVGIECKSVFDFIISNHDN